MSHGSMQEQHLKSLTQAPAASASWEGLVF